ncbi:hypothetical protein GCM10009552_29120 [Rothia nasimurium]
MSLHARPHLETHRRSSGHSAVAGVAYRLGLRLLDRRTGVWHDYRRRKLGEEIVRALTIAPEGAPEWATDPEELWNRVEAAEKRQDSQVARDYRIPIPLGLTDHQAGDMAEEMARFICRQLHTAVSLGLHRDSHIDALGAEKTAEKIGFHAHLYFPTRRLEEIASEDGTSGWAPGAKLVLLSNKNTAGAFVEQLNEKWADLARDQRQSNSQSMCWRRSSRNWTVDCGPNCAMSLPFGLAEAEPRPCRCSVSASKLTLRACKLAVTWYRKIGFGHHGGGNTKECYARWHHRDRLGY